MQLSRIKWLGAIIIVILFSLAAPPTSAQNNLPGDALQGGLLYDNWFYALDIPAPEGDNPLWRFQEMNDGKGEITWRCSECHGWDYKGKNGVYSSGIHRTDFPGVISSVDMPIEEIRAWLDGTNDPDHNIQEYIGPQSVEDLIAFLKTKPVNLNRFIDRETGKVFGDGENGYILYRAKCVSCHGYDGAFLTISMDGTKNYLSDLVFEDPWRMFHKIRFGHPGSVMPAMEAENWSMQNIADVLLYIQTLPQLREDHDLEGIEIVTIDYTKQADLGVLILGAAAIFLALLIGVIVTFRRASNY